MRFFIGVVIFGGILACFFHLFHLHNALPFYAYFSDPELTYIQNANLLASKGVVQHTDHPGTFLQLCGAAISKAAGLNPGKFFNDSSIEQFRLHWKFISFLATSALFCIAWFHLKSDNRVLVFPLFFLLLISDYNALVYWGTFTPEGSLYVLYLPGILLILAGLSKLGTHPVLSALLAGFCIGALTTIKLTLLPVSIFAISVFTFRATEGKTANKHTVFATGILTAIITFFALGSAFAADPYKQWSWLFSMVSHSGRYGLDTGDGAFLSLKETWNLTKTGLSLQNFTTLIPMVGFLILAFRDLFRSKTDTALRYIAGAYVLTFILTWLLFLKHPYQAKYLLGLLPLYAIYLLERFRQHSFPSPRKVLLATYPLLVMVDIISVTNYYFVHRYYGTLLNETKPIIDQALEHFQPTTVHFGIEVRHPLSSKAFALRETPALKDSAGAIDQYAHIFRQKSSEYKNLSESAIPFDDIPGNSLFFATIPFKDIRLETLYANPDLQLYIYRPVPEP